LGTNFVDWWCKSSCIGFYNGWDCFNTPGNVPETICNEICGDGILVGDETCDDGILNDGFGCWTDCWGAYLGWDC